MATENTPLTRTPPNFGSAPTMPFYVQDTFRFYSRRRRERQLQCIMFVTIVATFIMALIVTVSYSVNHPDAILPEDNATDADAKAGPLLQSPGLSAEEMQLALKAGNAAIAARRLADSRARPLPEASPESRHQFAVGTSSRAERMALAGVAELAATRELESSRATLGTPSRVGSFLDGGWALDELCAARPGCPQPSGKYREIDGSCNHPGQLGKAYAAYRRALPADYADGIDAPRRGSLGQPLPSAREVSLKVHPPSPSANPSFTVMLAVFGQFLDHDVTATALSQGANGSSLSCCPPGGGHPECFPVEVGPGDPVYDVAASSCMEFVRSAPAAQCRIGPRQQINQVTAFIDGSTVYGSDLETAGSLREFSGGRLRMQKTPDDRELLPASSDPRDGCNRKMESARGRYCFASGDRRANENLHLTTMHVLWARQHNLLADRLAQLNPQWGDETLYQEARRIVGAQLQHIAYREFVPIVLGEPEVAQRNLKPLDSGFRAMNATDVDPSIANNFAAAAFRFAHTLLPGLMKVTDMQNGTSSYVQLHKMLFNPYSLYAQGGVESSITSATTNPIQKTSTHVTSQLTEHLFEDPLGNQTSVPCGLDLVSLNIQRGRDHGLPGYTKWREHCGLGNPLNFDDLKDDMDPEALDAISKLYDNVDDVDLYTGALAELPRGKGLLGPTFTCLIADQFERLQLGDRYWYEFADQPGSFNQDQLKEIRKTTLARIICDTSDGIVQVQPEVMRSISEDNPMVSCEDIPQLSIDAWKSNIPVLTLSDAEVPFQDWISFKYEVNKTLTDIISNVTNKKPPPGTLPADWVAFQSGINKTFSDLKDKFSALHPKAITSVQLSRNLTAEQELFDWISIKNTVNNTVSDIIDAISAHKPPPGSLPTDWLEFKKQINDSLIDIKKKFKIFHPKSTVLNNSENNNQLGATSIADWIQIKNDINSTIADVVSSINASKPLPGSSPADWFAFKSKIVNSLADIKNKFKGLHPKPLVNMNSSDNLIVDEKFFDWTSISNAMDNAVSDILDSIGANKPPPGSPPTDWLEFKKKVNDSLVEIKKEFKIFHPKSTILKSNLENIKQSGDSSIADWIQIKNDINSTIADVVSSINASKPLPGSSPAEWFAFKSKIVNSLADIKNKFKGLHPKPLVNMNSSDNLTVDETFFDWMSINNAVDNTVSDILDTVSANKPPPGSLPTDWLEFKKKINDSLVDIRKKFKVFHPKSTTLKINSENVNKLGDKSIAYWSEIKNDINSTIADIVSSINASKPLPGSSSADWFAFKSKIVNSLADVKNNFKNVLLEAQYSTVKTSIKNDGSTFEWLGFKNKLNESLSNIIVSLGLKKPPAENTYKDWLQFEKEVNNTYNDLLVDFSDLDRNFNIKSDQLISDKSNEDSRNNVNKKVNEIIAEINASKPVPSSSQEDWDIFRQKMTNAFANMKNKSAFSQNKNKTLLLKLSDFSIDKKIDVIAFQENLNMSLINLISVIKNHKPAINSSKSDWLVYKKEVKVLLDKINDLFSEFKVQELSESEYTLYARESDGTIDWIEWKTQINETIDNLIKLVTNVSPNGDPKWISFRDYLNEYFESLKNKASSLLTNLSKPKLMALLQEDWFVFKDKVKETIEETLDDINSNKTAPEDPAFVNYNLYVKQRFAEMQEALKVIEIEWLQNVKAATDTMIVTDASVANNSASLLMPFFNFCTSFLLFAYITNLIPLSM